MSNIVYMSASGRQNRNGLWKLVWQTSKLIQIFIYHGIYKLPFGLSWFCLDYISGTNAGSFEIYFVMNDIILSRCWASLSCSIIWISRWVVYYAIFCQCLRSDAPLIGLLLHFRIYTENIILIERWKEANQFNQNMKINSSQPRPQQSWSCAVEVRIKVYSYMMRGFQQDV